MFSPRLRTGGLFVYAPFTPKMVGGKKDVCVCMPADAACIFNLSVLHRSGRDPLGFNVFMLVRGAFRRGGIHGLRKQAQQDRKEGGRPVRPGGSFGFPHTDLHA
jgi:hypothetical protein